MNLPQSEAAERSVLGSLLLDTDKLYSVDLRAQHFFAPKHRAVYEAILELHANGEPVDALSVEAKLGGRFGIDALDLLKLTDGVIPAASLGTHARVMHDHWLKRELRRLAEDVRASDEDGASLLQQHQAAVASLVADASPSGSEGGWLVGSVASEVVQQIKRRKDGAPPDGMVTGVAEFDRYLNLPRGGILILAGRPSMGKSATLEWMIESLIAQGERVALWSTESTREMVVTRLLARLTGINSKRLQLGHVSWEEWQQIQNAREQLNEWPLWIDDQALDVQDVARGIHKAKAQHRATVVAIDYLQELTFRRSGIRDERQLTNAVLTELRAAVKAEPAVYCVCASQLGRQVDRRENKRPVMSDLKESGKIEEVAYAVCLLYREYQYNKKADPGLMELLWAKNKDGATGPMVFAWDDHNGKCLGPLAGR